MRFKKIHPIGRHTNSPKNLVLRQQFALTLFDLIKKGKTILNLDETWLGMSDFRKRKWQAPGTQNSWPLVEIRPRVSMITAMDTQGKLYLTLVQANSNTAIMELYIRQLVLMLDRRQKNWRKEIVIMLDNAPYHTSETIMKLFHALEVPILFTGPHSYDASPIELFFAAFKKADINPRKVATGKK